jgi:hypothetical protein
MKKQLLTTTALVAAGLVAFGAPAAAKVKATVNGNMTAVFGIGENDDAFDAATQTSGLNSFVSSTDSEVHFNASSQLDNGVKIKVRVELEGENAGDQIDETWMRISGSFGELRMGAADVPVDTMVMGYAGNSASVGANHRFHTGSVLSTPGDVSVTNNTSVAIAGDASGVSYYTPRVSGFQLGVSYTPDADEDDSNRQQTGTFISHVKGIAANYVTKFDGASIAIAGGYNDGKNPTVDQDDPEEWQVAMQVKTGGVQVQASYHEIDEISTISTGATATAGQETVELGARYTMGKNAFSIIMIDAEAVADTGNAADGDEMTTLALAYKRTLGPGVTWSLTGTHIDADNGEVGAASSTSNSGEALMSRLQVKW